MSENLLRIELYRILVSIAVGLITILVFIFNVSVAERYYYNQTQRSDAEKKVIRQSMDSIESKNQVSINNLRFTWKDLKWAVKRTLRIFNENVIAFLVVSVFVGEFLGSLGLAIVTGFFQKSVDEGLYKKEEFYIDKYLGWRNITILFGTIGSEKRVLTLAFSEVYFSLAKACAGIFIGFYISYPTLYYPLAEAFEYKIVYFGMALLHIIFMLILLLPLFPSSIKLRLCLIDKVQIIVRVLSFPFLYILFFLSILWSMIISEPYTAIARNDPLIIVSLLYILIVSILFLLSIYNMKLSNQLRCLASEECYKKQDTTENTTSQPSTNQSPPQSPPKHTQEHHTQN